MQVRGRGIEYSVFGASQEILELKDPCLIRTEEDLTVSLMPRRLARLPFFVNSGSGSALPLISSGRTHNGYAAHLTDRHVRLDVVWADWERRGANSRLMRISCKPGRPHCKQMSSGLYGNVRQQWVRFPHHKPCTAGPTPASLS
ncbi:hypothetical protein J6590_066813 [Homalodisca vitripennis]|nr:hypothetical protein J6590_066813 [Homalodisca vitripennis]